MSMSGTQDQDSETLRDWDAYWQNAGLAPALRDGGPQNEALDRFWSNLLDRTLARGGESSRLLDIASGNGAVVRFALRSAERLGAVARLAITALDGSLSALEELRRRHPSVRCVVADALQLPFGARAFDIVTSQFGLEYAGPGAIAETARVIAPGGIFAAILHLKHGGIFRECAANREAAEGFLSSELLPSFDEVYRAAWALKESDGSAEALREADRKLAVAARRCEETLQRFGREIASGMLYRIYQDIGHMHARLGAYDPDEMAVWVRNMRQELDAYSGRMASMLEAALDRDHMAEASRDLVGAGLRIRLGGVLKFGRPPVPCAWAIIADRPR
jgi:ubiquinone/menaquinone biosynthesis C-methylase UbiE